MHTTHSRPSPLALALPLALFACNIPYADTGVESGVTDSGAGEDTDAGTTDADATTGGSAVSGTDGDGDSTTAGALPGGCDFEGAIQPIFTASCAFSGCHGGAGPQASMSLEAGSAYAALVGVASVQLDMQRVTPGELDASYLWEKLGPSPASGSSMPLGGQLQDGELALIEAWIVAGAPETEPFQDCEDAAAAEVEILGDDVSVLVGELVTLEAIATDGDGEPLDVPITWTSASGERLFIDRDGVGLGVSPGSVEVVASAGGVESAPLVVEVIDHDPPAEGFLGGALPVLQGSCALAGCHVDGVEPGDLRFDRDPDKLWEKLVGESAMQVPGMHRIAPGDPLGSYVLLKIVQATPAVGGQMPLGGGPLDADKALVILRWILDGAPYN